MQWNHLAIPKLVDEDICKSGGGRKFWRQVWNLHQIKMPKLAGGKSRAYAAKKASLSAWEKIMLEIFPNVEKGQTITGICLPSGTSVFYLDDTLLGEVNDKAFTTKFFDIWLGDKTSEPKLRSKLLKL